MRLKIYKYLHTNDKSFIRFIKMYWKERVWFPITFGFILSFKSTSTEDRFAFVLWIPLSCSRCDEQAASSALSELQVLRVDNVKLRHAHEKSKVIKPEWCSWIFFLLIICVEIILFNVLIFLLRGNAFSTVLLPDGDTDKTLECCTSVQRCNPQ